MFERSIEMLGDRLKSLRLLNNLTQKQVGLSLNLSEARYGQYENNKRNPDYNTLKEFAKFYNVSTDYLLDNNTKIEKVEKDVIEYEVLKKVLISIGYLKDGEDLTKQELKKLMEFVKDNKKYIKEIK